MKKFALFTTLLMLMSFNTITAQGSPTVLVQVDGKIMFFGDEEHNIDAGLNNVSIKSRWTGNQAKWGYLYVAPTFEYAKLTTDLPEYYRWSAEVGYTFNRFLEDRLEFGVYADYGITKRGLANMSFGFGGTTGYKITKAMKVVATLQFVNRVDFEWIYNMPAEIKYSVFVGLEWTIFANRRTKMTRF